MLIRVPVRVHAEHGRDIYDPNGTVKKYQILRRFCAKVVHYVVTVSKVLESWLVESVGLPCNKISLRRLAQALLKLQRDTNLRCKLAKTSRTTVEPSFSQTKMIEDYQRLYQRKEL